MAIIRSIPIQICVLGLWAGFASGAQAACGPFEVISDGSERKVFYLDEGDEGPSVGDKRVGFRVVKDADGNPLGEHQWINQTVLLDASGNPSRTMETHAVTLEDGQLFYSVANKLISPPALTERPSVPDHVGVVTGGSGVYASATGTVSIAFDGNGISYSFDISCR